MKKMVSILLLIIVTFSLSIPGYAINENFDKYDEYISYIEMGVLSEDISYTEWLYLVEENNRLMEILNNSENFTQVYSGNSADLSDLTFQVGDVLITNDIHTASAGIIGHAAIATSSTYILHIQGTGYNPSKIEKLDWIDLYDEGCTTVYRHNNINVANSAAIWANQKYMSEYRNATYRITNDLFSFSETYCSKIVWQAYYYVEPIGTYGRDPYPVGVVTPGMLPNQITGVSLNGSYGV